VDGSQWIALLGVLGVGSMVGPLLTRVYDHAKGRKSDRRSYEASLVEARDRAEARAKSLQDQLDTLRTEHRALVDQMQGQRDEALKAKRLAEEHASRLRTMLAHTGEIQIPDWPT